MYVSMDVTSAGGNLLNHVTTLHWKQLASVERERVAVNAMASRPLASIPGIWGWEGGMKL